MNSFAYNCRTEEFALQVYILTSVFITITMTHRVKKRRTKTRERTQLKRDKVASPSV
jgi:hypothetical protein